MCFRPQLMKGGDTYSVESLDNRRQIPASVGGFPVQWLRLALSKGHNRVGVFPLTWRRKKI
jgi:hypothetical protein